MKKKKIVKDSYIVRTKKRILRDTIETEKKYTTNFKDIRNCLLYTSPSPRD